jgi:hypothetical protein
VDESVAAALSAKAAAQGLSIQAFLETILLSTPPVARPRLSLVEIERLLDEEATVGPSPSGTFSRAELYSDHD